MSQGNWAEAIDLGEQAIEHAANDAQRTRALTMVGRSYAKLGDTAQACAALSEALATIENEQVNKLYAELGCDE